jgi:hypothetical protein
MRRRQFYFIVAACLPRTVVAAPEPFSFVLPEGFVDITNGEKPPLSPIDDAVFERAKEFDFFAVKLREGAVVAACAAKVADGRAPVTEVSKFTPERLPAGSAYRVLSMSVSKIAGVDCGRVESEQTSQEGVVRALTFVMPSQDRWAQFKLNVFEPTQYAELAAAFEAAAARTGGVAPSKPPPGAAVSPFLGLAIAAFVGSVIGKWIRGRKRTTAWRQAKQSPRAR